LKGGYIVDIGNAVERMRQGQHVARAGWNGKNMWLALVDSHHYQVDVTITVTPATQEPLKLAPWIGMRTADNKFVPWLCSQTDLLADDWVVVY
jgi:hypothetical protein